MKTAVLLSTCLLLAPLLVIASEDETPVCATPFAAIHHVPPSIERIHHNTFKGHAMVSFIVDIHGGVQNPAIIESQWQPVGRTGKQPVGYEEAILAAIVQWRFPPPKLPCRRQQKINFALHDDWSKPIGDEP